MAKMLKVERCGECKHYKHIGKNGVGDYGDCEELQRRVNAEWVHNKCPLPTYPEKEDEQGGR